MTPLAFSAHTFPAPSGDAWALAAAAPVLDSLGEQGEVSSKVPRTSGSSTLGALEAGAFASHPTDGRTTTPGADLIRLLPDFSPEDIKLVHANLSPDQIRQLPDFSPASIESLRRYLRADSEYRAFMKLGETERGGKKVKNK